MDLQSIITSRGTGEARLVVVTETTGNMARVLTKCGLRPEPQSLVAHSREDAEAILQALLWKDMAYESELMPRQHAHELAVQLLNNFAAPDGRYFSNGNWTKSEQWSPLTESTFDAGLVFCTGLNTFFCIWFEDED